MSTSRVYYNEFDPQAAQWLRNLISAGLIAPGYVDERSIKDVRPEDLKGYTQCHFFAGIGGWSYALRLAGWGDDRPVWTGSCPCQPFSNAGTGGGTRDPRHLWPEFKRLIGECNPPTVFGEQVASKAGRDWLLGVQTDLQDLGYATAGADICAAGINAPHIRQRLWWVGRLVDSESKRALRESGEFFETDGGQVDRQGRESLGSSGLSCGMADSIEPRLEGHPGNGTNGGEPGRYNTETVGPATQDSSDCGMDDTLDDKHSPDRRRNGETDSLQGINRTSVCSGKSESRLANPAVHGYTECGTNDGTAESIGGRMFEPSRDMPSCGMGNSEGNNKLRNTLSGQNGERSEIGRSSSNRRIPDTGLLGSQERQQQTAGNEQCGEISPWNDSILIPCKDGKYRRIKHGVEPLAYGLPRGVGKLLPRIPGFEPYIKSAVRNKNTQLKGYGNAIVPQVAAIFIKSYMGVMDEGS